jgi:uncharacterized protein
MIVDCHTHYWEPHHLQPTWTDQLDRINREGDVGDPTCVTQESYCRGTAGADRTIVFGLQARASGVMVPNDDVAAFARASGGRSVGFLSVDPVDDGAADEVERAALDLGLVGLKVGPIYQGTNPLNPRTIRVFERAQHLGLPMIIHQGAAFATTGRLRDASPLLIDDVALAFPDLKIIVAHMGHPWVNETAVVMRRHRNVYGDIAAMHRRPYMLAMAFAAAHEYGVFDKVLFGTDFPFTSVAASITGVEHVVRIMADLMPNHVTAAAVDDLVHRRTFDLLELRAPTAPEAAATSGDGLGTPAGLPAQPT